MDFETVRTFATEYQTALSLIGTAVAGYTIGCLYSKFSSRNFLERKKLDTQVRLAEEETRRLDIASQRQDRQERLDAIRIGLPDLNGNLKPVIDSYNQELTAHRQRVTNARQAIVEKRRVIREELFNEYQRHHGRFIFDDNLDFEELVDAKCPDDVDELYPTPELPGELRKLLNLLE